MTGSAAVSYKKLIVQEVFNRNLWYPTLKGKDKHPGSFPGLEVFSQAHLSHQVHQQISALRLSLSPNAKAFTAALSLQQTLFTQYLLKIPYTAASPSTEIKIRDQQF